MIDNQPSPISTTPDRVAGMLLALAIGDALGNTSEGILPVTRRLRFGEVRDYLSAPSMSKARPAGRGYPSDDTQMAFWMLDQINKDGGFVAENVLQRFAVGQITGIGLII